MRHKILTIDDSRTVRIIVRKAFRTFDCEISEAANGVEGLAVASKTKPDLILLDITMPVMDGVETLTRLKADPQLKGIPVMMLTAEGGRDNVLKIAKIGVRDYIVKPFKEDTLIEKAGRIIDLKPANDPAGRQRSILDAADILVVEDKPAIYQQIEEGLKHTPWRFHSTTSQAEALEFCSRLSPDLIVISLSLPDESAYTLLRAIRTNLKTKFTPVFALVVKTDMAGQAQAQQVGFSSIVTKPIDLLDLESKVAKAMNLDTSMRYFRNDGAYLVMNLPENCPPAILAEASQYLQSKVADAVNAGQSKMILDIHLVKGLHMGVIKLLLQAMQTCRELAMHFALVGNQQIISDCKNFEDTRAWHFLETIEEAKVQLTKGPTSTPPNPELVGA